MPAPISIFATRRRIKMKSAYYLFNAGKISKRNNSLLFERGYIIENEYFDFIREDKMYPSQLTLFANDENQLPARQSLPIEGVSEFHIFGNVSINSALLNFLGKKGVLLHFFDYYGNYTGSFFSKEQFLAGQVRMKQAELALDGQRRLSLARKIVEGSIFNLRVNLLYYNSRGKDVEAYANALTEINRAARKTVSINELMAYEGNARKVYYQAVNKIVSPWSMPNRNRQPPLDPVNSLISLGNSLLYARCISELYRTQLDPCISFLHEPGVRRFSLALDLAEIFKPVIVDRTIFKALNRNQIQHKDFAPFEGGIILKSKARKVFINLLDEKFKQTIQHRGLNRSISYRRLIRLEAYKLVKHIMNIEQYQPWHSRW